MVVTLSPFKTNLEFSDVLLPIAPFTETSGTFVNAEGRVQGFHAVVRPLGESRPGWKVLRVLANLLGLPAFDFESSQDVLKTARGAQDAGQRRGEKGADYNDGLSSPHRGACTKRIRSCSFPKHLPRPPRPPRRPSRRCPA